MILRILSFFLIFITQSSSVLADDLLPYSVRSKAYSGWSSTVRGDITNIGMAGATVAVPYSISSLESNPAGLTMTMGSLSAQINSNSMTDTRVSNSKRVTSNQWGVAVSPLPWGFSMTYYTPTFEGGNFISPLSGRSNETEISLKQLRLSGSRIFLNDRVSLGGSVELDKAIRQLGQESRDAYDLGVKAGILIRLDRHALIGLSFSPPMEIGTAENASSPTELPGYAQPIRAPFLLTLGAGWMPNRFFRAGASVTGVGPTHSTALLRDESKLVGRSFTLQPRMGLSYVAAEYNYLKVELSAGSYYEVSRIQGYENRLHGTFGIEVNPWFINTGFGIDRADNYNNLIVSIGIDIVRTVRALDLIPKDSVPPYRGVFPHPTKIQSDGLPDSLTSGEKKTYSSPDLGDVGTIIKDIPKRFEDKFNSKSKTPKDSGKKKKKKKKIKPSVSDDFET